MTLRVLAFLVAAALPAAAGPMTPSFADHLGALAAAPVALGPEMAGLARSIGLDARSPLSAALAGAVAAHLPEGFDKDLSAALAAGDAPALSRLAAVLDEAKAAAGPDVDNVVRGYVGALKEDVAKNDFTRARLRRAAAALASLASWGGAVADQAEAVSRLASAATLDAARAWAKGLAFDEQAEPEGAIVPVSAREAHGVYSEYATAGREAYAYGIAQALQGDLENVQMRSDPDTGATMIYGRLPHVLLATAGPRPNGEGVTLTWSGPKKTLPDGSSAPVWNGRVVDVRLSLAQAGWDVNQIGPLRYQVGKRSMEVRDAVVKALRGNLRLAGRPNEGIQPKKRKVEYSKDAEQPAVLRLDLSDPR